MAKRRVADFVWPVIGLGAVAFSAWLLYNELRGISLEDILDSLLAIPAHSWFLSAAAAVGAYAALAGYDRIALLHLNRKVPWRFITLCSFTTYALSHNIGASVVSGAVVRYRAYRSQGLTPAEVGVLVAFCSFTFALGVVILAGFVLVVEPELVLRYHIDVPQGVARMVGFGLLALVALYVFGAWRGFRPLTIGSFSIYYPSLKVVWQQLLIGPIEVVSAAAIIYFVLPEAGNPGFLVILGVFLASFSAALISHAPGGLGVLEFVFLTALDEMDPAGVMAALIVFRLFYLLIPLAFALLVVLAFEHAQFGRKAEAGEKR